MELKYSEERVIELQVEIDIMRKAIATKEGSDKAV